MFFGLKKFVFGIEAKGIFFLVCRFLEQNFFFYFKIHIKKINLSKFVFTRARVTTLIKRPFLKGNHFVII